jgi:hypothetical protein
MVKKRLHNSPRPSERYLGAKAYRVILWAKLRSGELKPRVGDFVHYSGQKARVCGFVVEIRRGRIGPKKKTNKNKDEGMTNWYIVRLASGKREWVPEEDTVFIAPREWR